MKSYLPAIIAAVIIIVGVGLLLFATPALQSPQAKLDARVNARLAQAEASLYSYDPLDERLGTLLAAPTTEPAEPGVQEYRTQLERRSKLVDNAVAEAREAVNEQVESGGQTYTGSSSPAATRFLTVALSAQANMLRRRAQADRSDSRRELGRFEALVAAWDTVDTQTRSVDRLLNGPAAEPPRVRPTASAPAGEISAEAEQPAATEQPAPQAEAQPSAPPQGSGGLFSNLTRRLTGRPGAAPSAPPAPAPRPKPVAKTPPAVAKAPSTPARTAQEQWHPAPASRPARQGPLTPTCPMQLTPQALAERADASIAERIADLRLCEQQVQEKITSAQSDVGKLTPQVNDLRKRSEAATAAAQTAQKRMLALDQAGIDHSDPKALDRFTKEYNAASDEYRRALREAAILTSGSADQPQLKEREKEVLTAPVIPVAAGLEKPQLGLAELEAELRTAQGLVKGNEAVLARITKQIEALTAQEAALRTRLETLRAERAKLAQEAADAARQVIASNLEAEQLETQALQTLSGPAAQAAKNAERAAEDWINQARAEGSEHPDSPNPRLTMITGSRSLVGHIKTLSGDVQYTTALVQAQRAEGLDAHARLLDDLIPTGQSVTTLLPKGEGAAQPQAWVTNPDAARQAAQAARAEALKAAEAAKEGYKRADNDLKQLWVLHANMAAIDFLMANLTTGQEAAKHAADARREYELSTRDKDPAKARPYVRAMETLSRASR